MFPPQARGWTCYRLHFVASRSVSPAGAGMDRCRPSEGPRSSRFPRRRGDGPLGNGSPPAAGVFPPQARGWTRLGAGAGPGADVSPAGAGMDRTMTSAAWASTGFPRRRGDGPQPVQGQVRWDLFPPQARGWTVESVWGSHAASVSPAGAGMDRTWRHRSETEPPNAQKVSHLGRVQPPTLVERARGSPSQGRCRRGSSPGLRGVSPSASSTVSRHR